MSSFTVNREKCTRCKICLSVCTTGILIPDSDGFPKMSDDPGGRCLECCHCVLNCPSDANALSFMDPSKLVAVKELVMPGAEQALNFLRTRRSVRVFSDKPVSKETLGRIMDTVLLSPTASNTQLVRWIISFNTMKTEKIKELSFEWLRNVAANQPDTPYGQTGKMMISFAERGIDRLLRGAPYIAFAVVPKEWGWPQDGSIALTYFELAAHAVGVGCCWGGYLTMITRNYAPLREYLGIKDDEHLCGVQMFGYPKIRPTKQYPKRRALKVNLL